MSEPSLRFRELLDYTDYLAQRWLEYFRQHEQALDIEVGGRMQTMRNLVGHIFQVQSFFADLLAHEPATPPTVPPPQMEAPSLETMQRMHQQAMEKLGQYIERASEENLQQKRKLGPVTVSNRKTLAQPLIHSIHHWAQVAKAIRQAGFPAQPPQDIIVSPTMQ